MLWRVSDLDPERLERIGKLLALVEVAGRAPGVDPSAIIAEVRQMIEGCDGTVIDGIRSNIDQAEAAAADGDDAHPTAHRLVRVLRAAIDARRPTADLLAIRSEIARLDSDGSDLAQADELLGEVSSS
jgi:hypothetical protein